MTPFTQFIAVGIGAACLAITASAQSESTPPVNPASPPPAKSTPASGLKTTTEEVALPRDDSASTPAPAPAKAPERNSASRKVSDNPSPAGEPSLRMNFRGAALEQVLDYLSDAAGFIIVLDTTLSGKVDVWSNQPLNREEAVELLNTVLGKNGYTALRSGRTLTIVSRDDAKKKGDTPVRVSNDPTTIPKSEEVVTQIIPVKFINAVQLNRDLQTLVPSTASMAANEGGNAILMTDTMTNIRRFTEIVHALDTSIASVSAVRVFQLKYADAKAVATVIRDLFSSTDTGNRANNQQNQQVFRGARGGPGGGGFPGFPGMGGGGGGPGGAAGGADPAASGNARVSSPKVVAVSDERSNSLVVSAPEEQMTVIKDLVEQVDTNVEDVTELRVFHLKFADPTEMSEVLSGLFPDPTSSSSQGGNRGGQIRFGGFGGFGGAGGGNRGGQGAGANTSDRMLKQSKVVAVPDLRTQSIVVSAARELMGQIEGVIERLDSDPARKQKVFVYSVENSDPQAVADILKGLFQSQNNNRAQTSANSSRQTGNQLNNRATQNQNQGNRNSSGSGFGGSGGRTSGFGQAGQ